MHGIADEVAEVRVGEARAWTLRRSSRRARGPIVRLLPGWDTYLMGWRDRDFFALPDDWRRITPGGGMLKPTILVDGRAAGLWRIERRGRRLAVELEPFTNADAATRERLNAEIADVLRFEGQTS
jgi:hypothetical protein